MSSSPDPQPTSVDDEAFREGCRQAVIDLHEFFEAWFNGTLPETAESLSRFQETLAADFEYVAPSGHHFKKAELFEDGRWPGHGYWRQEERSGGRVRVESFAYRRASPETALVTFEYWQDVGSSSHGRLNTALLRLQMERPFGVIFVHVQETWLPGTKKS